MTMEEIVERERLVTALRENGIRFLAGGDGAGAKSDRLSPSELIGNLARHPDPRLRLSLTSLFLLHPDWAVHVPAVVATLDLRAAQELQARYMAAVYLQRTWRTRLGFYLGDFETLPDLYSQALGLPPPDERFGKTGLVALAEWHASHSEYPFNRLASYHKAADLLFGQLIAEARQREFAATG
jgi:hypothetical protein